MISTVQALPAAAPMVSEFPTLFSMATAVMSMASEKIEAMTKAIAQATGLLQWYHGIPDLLWVVSYSGHLTIVDPPQTPDLSKFVASVKATVRKHEGAGCILATIRQDVPTFDGLCEAMIFTSTIGDDVQVFVVPFTRTPNGIEVSPPFRQAAHVEAPESLS